jgi:hypothetical protein
VFWNLQLGARGVPLLAPKVFSTHLASDSFPLHSADLSRGKRPGGLLLACFRLLVFANTQAP